MSKEHKYVRHRTLGFILWPMTDKTFHSMVGKLFVTTEGSDLVSAGFVHISKGDVYCYGKSESLGIKANPQDSAALAAQLGLK